MASGSDTRQRGVSISARFNDEEAAYVRGAADRAGVSVASLIRIAVLDEPPARATRRPVFDTALVARMVHDLGPVADSLRQIAAQPGAGEDPRLSVALDQLADMSFICLQAMGRSPARRPIDAMPLPSFPEPLAAIWERAARDPAGMPAPVPPSMEPPPP